MYEVYMNFLRSQSGSCEWPSEKERLFENNFVVENLIPVVFLNNAKNGFNIIQIGSMAEIIEAFKNEYLAFNGEYYPMVELISFEKIFDCQKLEPGSQIYKATITKEELVCIHQFTAALCEYSILFFIEAVGDPCGVMNRINDVLLFSLKSGHTDNRRALSFNYIKGFLIGTNPQSCYHMNSDVDAFIYYNSLLNKWMLTDLTRFLNPLVYYSQDFFGLWACISSDKKANHRYSSETFYVKSEDEIKVSETIMKLKIDDL
jgi:hypothetical protein